MRRTGSASAPCSGADREARRRTARTRATSAYQPGVFRSLDHRAAGPDGRAGGQFTLADLSLAVADDRRSDQVPGPDGPVAGPDRDGFPGADRLNHAALERQRLGAHGSLHRELAVDPAQQEEREDAAARPAAVRRTDADPPGQPAQSGPVRGPGDPACSGAGGRLRGRPAWAPAAAPAPPVSVVPAAVSAPGAEASLSVWSSRAPSRRRDAAGPACPGAAPPEAGEEWLASLIPAMVPPPASRTATSRPAVQCSAVR